MPLPLRLQAIAQPPSGPEKRFALDSPIAGDRPGGLSFSDTVPGGFESCDFGLLRDARHELNDLPAFTNVRIEGPGRALAWEGRVEAVGQTTDQGKSVSPSLVGWQAALEDDETAAMIYRTVSLDDWAGMSRGRMLAGIASTIRGIGDGDVTQDNTSGEPAISVGYDGGSWAANYGPRIEAWHDAGPGIKIAKFWGRLAMTALLGFFYNPASAMRCMVWSCETDDGTGTAQYNIIAAYAASQDVAWTLPTPQRFVSVEMLYNNTGAAAIGDNANLNSFWTKVALHGNHGLTQRGTEPAAGYYASDIIEHAVRTWAPILNRSIDPTAFIIPHASFIEPTTAAEILRFANAYHLYDWGVWDNKTFNYYARGARGRKWRARVGSSNLQEAGVQIDRLWNGVVVSYPDVDGTTRTVGPLGSGSNYMSATLSSADPQNAANAAGLRRWTRLEVGHVTTQEGAVEIGRRFLIETMQLNRSGSAVLTGYVMDDRGVLRPAWQVRAGDEISFIDAFDTSYRRIVRKNYDHDTHASTVDLDAPPAGLDALLERLGAVIAPLGL